MIEQALTPEFLDFFQTFKGSGEQPHDTVSGLCKCGQFHKPYEFQLMAVKEFQQIQKLQKREGSK